MGFIPTLWYAGGMLSRGIASLLMARKWKVTFSSHPSLGYSLVGCAGRLLLAAFVLAGLSACSSSQHAVSPVATCWLSAEEPKEVKRVTRPRPAASPRRPAPQPIVVTQRVAPSESSATAKPPENRRAQVIRLVSAGRLKSSDGEYLTFENSSKAVNSSLYEDAITLGRLRGRLQTMPAVDDALVSSATVNNGGAFIVIGADLTARQAAEIIDKALGTKDVILVKVRLKKS